jgi:sugar phosphate isomerase/epimerase
LRTSLLAAGGWRLAAQASLASEAGDFQISLNELSFQRALSSGRLEHLQLARTARTQFDIAAVEYASRFFREEARNEKHLIEMNKRAADQDVRQLLIMVDGEGRLGDADAEQRKKAVHNHHKWVDAAEVLGCQSIAVETAGTGTPEERLGRVTEGIRALCEYAEPHHINVLAGSPETQAASADWLLRAIRQVDHPACGAIVTFAALGAAGNQKGGVELFPLARAVSATSRDFHADGRETRIDFFRIVSAVLNGRYRGYVGIDYQGEKLGEAEGIRATKALLEAARSAAGSQFGPAQK